MKSLLKLISIALTYRPLFLAAVAMVQACLDATTTDSKGGRRIMPDERQPINRAFWRTYDRATMRKR